MTISITTSITGVVVGRIQGIQLTPGMNVQGAMEAAYNIAHAPVASFSLQYFGGPLGYEVTELDGIASQVGADNSTFFFWELLINGQPAQTGIDSTFPHDGDQIGWNYTVYDATTHGGTRHEQVREKLANLRRA